MCKVRAGGGRRASEVVSVRGGAQRPRRWPASVGAPWLRLRREVVAVGLPPHRRWTREGEDSGSSSGDSGAAGHQQIDAAALRQARDGRPRPRKGRPWRGGRGGGRGVDLADSAQGAAAECRGGVGEVAAGAAGLFCTCGGRRRSGGRGGGAAAVGGGRGRRRFPWQFSFARVK